MPREACSKENKIELDGNVLKISVKSPTENNEANKEVLKLLKDAFGAAEIVKGIRSSKKLISLPANDLLSIKTRLDES